MGRIMTRLKAAARPLATLTRHLALHPSAFGQTMVILVTLLLSWYGMLATHELGHALHAWMSDGRVVRVVVPLVGFSRTDVWPNPHPLFVAWGGPVWGVLVPVAVWGIAQWLRPGVAHVPRFAAGFSLIANGAYLGVGAFTAAGDAGDLMSLGARRWTLTAFALVTLPIGLYLWHGLGPRFGLRNRQQPPFAAPPRPGSLPPKGRG